MQTSVLNKQGKFGVKILRRYTDMAIFVLRCFILTHPVYCVGWGVKLYSTNLCIGLLLIVMTLYI